VLSAVVYYYTPSSLMLSAANTLFVGYVTALWVRVRVGFGVHGAQICAMLVRIRISARKTVLAQSLALASCNK